MFNYRSGAWQLSSYDFWAPLRGILLFFLAGLLVNLDAVREILGTWGIAPIYANLVVWYLVDLGRRYVVDYKSGNGFNG